MRYFRNVCYFLIGFLGIAYVEISYAETVPASGPNYMYNGEPQPNLQTACELSWAGTGYTYFGATACSGNWQTDNTYQCNCSRSNGSGGGIDTGITEPYRWYCPAGQNWTIDNVNHTCSRPDCTAGQTRDANGVCQSPTCPAGQTLDPVTGTCTPPPCTAQPNAYGGYFDMGTDPKNAPTNTPCIAGCQHVIADGTAPARTSMVDGVLHYFAQMTYDRVAEQCSPDTNLNALVSTPQSTCSANQQLAQINGQDICVNKLTGAVEAKSKPDTQVKKEPTVTNPDGSTTDKVERIYSDGSSSQTVVNCTGAGACTTTTTTQGGGIAAASIEPPKTPLCVEKPNDPSCIVHWSAGAGTGSFASKASAIATKKTDFATTISNVKAEAASLFTFATATQPELTCGTSYSFLGHDIQFCLNKYQTELAKVADALLFIAYVLAAFVLFA